MRRLIVAALIAVAALLSGCGTGFPSIQLGESRTLAAAASAAQERANRFSSGDYAGAWLLSSKQLHDAISQGDYVTYQQACASKLTRLPRTVIGVRMDGDNRAIVREEVMGFKNSMTMVYEDGSWVQAPSDFWIQNAGKSAYQIIAESKSAGRCASDEPLPPTITTASPTPSPTPTTPNQPPISWPDTTEVRADRPGDYAHLVAVRLARNDGFDRLVLEFAERVPSYTVGYRPLPARADGSGNEIPLPGASAVVYIALKPATADGWDGGGRTYFGPSKVTNGTAIVTEAKEAGDFESHLTWVVGLRAKVKFSVLVFAGPPRLVIDFQH